MSINTIIIEIDVSGERAGAVLVSHALIAELSDLKDAESEVKDVRVRVVEGQADGS